MFTLDPDELETPWYRPFGGTLPVKSRISRKPSSHNDASVDMSGIPVVQAATLMSLAAKSRLREQMVLDVVKLSRVAVEAVGKERRPLAKASCHWQNDVSLGVTVGLSRGVAAGRMDSGGLGVVLPCASAKRSQLLPEVFDACSYVGCRLFII